MSGANCSRPRRVGKTSAPQSTPFARQRAASRAPLLRMRFLWTGYLSARHDFLHRPLSVGTRPTVTTTCKANTGKMTWFLRCHRTGRQVWRWSVGHDAPKQPYASWPGLTRRGVAPTAGRALMRSAGRNSLAVGSVPRRARATTPAGLGIRCSSETKSPRMPEPYPRIKTGSRSLDARLMGGQILHSTVTRMPPTFRLLCHQRRGRISGDQHRHVSPNRSAASAGSRSS